jgi:hypothetical protein
MVDDTGDFGWLPAGYLRVRPSSTADPVQKHSREKAMQQFDKAPRQLQRDMFAQLLNSVHHIQTATTENAAALAQVHEMWKAMDL